MTFQEALARRHVPYRQGNSDRAKISINCPFCAERGKPTDTKFRLCIHAVQGWARCVHCGWKWRSGAVSIVLLRLGANTEEVRGFAAPEARQEIPIALPADFQLLTQVTDSLDRIARCYLLDRGITPSQIADYWIGVSYAGRYAYRIIFPVNYQNKLVGINARDFIGHREPKYLNSPGAKYLFGFDPKAKTCVLSEGVFKALRIAQALAFNSCALLGHNLTDVQLQQLQQSACRRVVLYPDADTVGRRGMASVADRLREHWSGRVDAVWDNKLPADEEAITVIRNQIHQAAPIPFPRHW